jgi:hypothetical protein
MGENKGTPSLGSREYWLEEIMKFRTMMGEKTFWKDVEMAGRALYGLMYVWVHTTNFTENDSNLMTATCGEYDRRLAYVLSSLI